MPRDLPYIVRSLKVRSKLLSREVRFYFKKVLRAIGLAKILVPNAVRVYRPREKSVRPETLTRDALYEHGRILAESHQAAVLKRGSRLIYRRFAHHCRQLELAHRNLENASHQQEVLTPGAEWLLDNYHLVIQQIDDIKRHFPHGYDRTLPKLVTGKYADFPRVYNIAIELLLKSDSVVNIDLLSSLIRGYQTHSPLSMGELWAVPIMLRFALIENLGAIVARMANAKQERIAAGLLIDEILGDENRTGTQILQALTESLNSRPELLFRGSSHIIARLRELGRKAYLALQWLEERLREEGLDPEELHRNEQYTLAADQVSIGNTVNSLRAVSLIDWKEWVENISLLEKVLYNDPAKIYQDCDFKTRDNYRHVIERLASKVGKSEIEISRALIELAESKHQSFINGSECDPLYVTKRSHIGYYLIGAGLPELEKKLSYQPSLFSNLTRFMKSNSFAFYAFGIILVTVMILFHLASYLVSIDAALHSAFVISLLFVVPAADLATSFVQWLVTRILEPDFLPKLDFSKGIPEEACTVVVVQSIFGDCESIARTVEGLEVRFLANQDKNLSYGILADLRDSEIEESEVDIKLIEYAKRLITDLNERYLTNTFFILFRKRQWNSSQNVFMAWERKRGKIEEFNRLILGANDTSFVVTAAERELLRKTKYVVTLDSDSQLPNGVVRKLVGTISHPLNSPLIARGESSESKPRILEGYSLIQPRVGVSLVSGNTSLFSKIFSGHSGLDPYTQTVSEVYQDLFNEGSSFGKGIYSVEAFHTALEGRVPDNAILSHDLFEGLFSRVALVSDVEIFDDFPAKYHVHARRQHRWVRGDWQLLPWIFSKVPNRSLVLYRTALSPLGRWKLIDNLRRSLLAPSLLLLFIAAWTLLPTPSLYITALGLLVLAFPVYANVAQAFLIPPRGLSIAGHVKGVGRDIFNQSKQTFFTLCFVPHQAWLMLNAIIVTLKRIFITKSNLLEWETAYHSDRRLSQNYFSYFKEMVGGVILTILAAIAIAFAPTSNLVFTLPLIMIWLAAPFLAKRLSDPIPERVFNVESDQRVYLTEIAFQNWRFFRELMTIDNNYLAPDNIQLSPNRTVVDRTSITNVSLSMLGTVAAVDFGFMSAPRGVELLSKTFDALSKLERFHGHFLNWYNIQTLKSLYPRYISMVDSGNMIGHLIALRTSLDEIEVGALFADKNILHLNYLLTKLLTAKNLNKEIVSLINNCQSLLSMSEKMQSCEGVLELITSISSLVLFARNQRDISADSEVALLLNYLEDLTDVGVYLPWKIIIHKLNRILSETNHENNRSLFPESLGKLLACSIPSLKVIEDAIHEIDPVISEIQKINLPDSSRTIVNALLKEHDNLLQSVKNASIKFKSSITLVRRYCNDFISEMDFRFLYDADRELFPIGYDIDNGRKDQSYYDLLASEARLGSLVAVALGQIPQQHWFSLGRPLTDSFGGKALLSWSGTMFEYLMPLLVTKDFAGTLLSETYKAAVRTQIAYGDKRGVPWGVSESGYSGVDFEKTYQYHAFGVPGLGLKRGLEEDLVISPYSTFLALSIAYPEGMQNLKLLDKEGARGEYGFYEAIDYTPTRLSNNERSHIVKSHLAHHQGMTLIALANLLFDNIFQERFHADRQIQATELLLQERFPDRVPIVVSHGEQIYAGGRVQEEEATITSLTLTSAHTLIPLTHLLSNSRYSLMVDNAGGGFSMFERDLMLTRWREDPLANNYGSFVYVRDLKKKKIWSNTYQPTRVEPETYEVLFGPDKAEFKRKDFDIFTHTEITISPEDNVEIRKLSFSNLSGEQRVIDVTSYGEVVLGSARADNAHPAFSKMFIESEYISDLDCLIYSRRPRSRSESPLFFFHMLTMQLVWDKVQFESARSEFIGRGNSVYEPQVMGWDNKLGENSGYVLDPIYSLRTRIELEPGQSETVNFISGVSRNKEELLQIAQRYKQTHQVSRAFEMAWSQSSVELRNEKFAARQSQIFQRLANALIYNVDKLRCSSTLVAHNRMAQPGLWRLGISGDLPIVVLRITEPEQSKVLIELLAAHHYLRIRGLAFDLVVLNEYPGGYLQNLQEELEYMIKASFSGYLMDKPGGVFLRTTTQVSQNEVELIQVVARVVLTGSRGALMHQIKIDEVTAEPPPKRQNTIALKSSHDFSDYTKKLEYFNGIGGFSDNGKNYVSIIKHDKLPPLPWSQVLANPSFGTLITETGAGYTWSENSREFRISPWSNDPISDPNGEALYIRDTSSGKFWSPTPRPIKSSAAYKVEYRLGEVSFESEIEDISSDLTIVVPKSDKAKWWHLKLKNNTRITRQLEIFLYLNWVLGVSRDDTNRFLITGYDSQSKLLYAQNHYNTDFPGRVVAIGSNLDLRGFTTSRMEFIGRHSDLSAPRLLVGEGGVPSSGISLRKYLGAGHDSCGVIKNVIELEAGQERSILFYVAEGESLDEVRQLSSKLGDEKYFYSSRSVVLDDNNQLLSAIQVSTPDKSLDIMLNNWLPYQSLISRLYARTGFYQSGGAFGFRDQLQDVLTFLVSRPELTRRQILLHSTRQFLEGDVQHWWHPPSGKGVRTKITDDYLFLPYVVCRYLDATGDYSILDEQATYLTAPILPEHEMEAYIVPQVSNVSGSVYEHCIKAIERGLNFGSHGLPLMGAGDWNDGMNEVGKEGKGESVWLAWFLIDVLKRFAILCNKRGEPVRSENYLSVTEKVRQAIESNAWDGEWYRRAYFDDGSPLGSKSNDECQIDSISQSWSIISGAGEELRIKSAMQNVQDRLVDQEHGIIALLAPAFNSGVQHPGYIKGYLPGIRENGGQYTHAAAWTVIANAILGMGDRAHSLFSMINPVNHTSSANGVNKYKGEPYVLCGDVYSVAPHQGRAGWSWYTGSAGWLYQAGIEYILGIRVFAEYLLLDPCIPHSWKEYFVTLRTHGSTFIISIQNPDGKERGVKQILVDGREIDDKKIVFSEFAGRLEVKVIVIMG